MKKALVVLALMFSTALFSQTADECFKKGIEYANKGQYDKAIEELKKALEFSPGLAEYHLNLGVVYANKKDYDNAITEVENSIKSNSNNVMAHYVLAMLCEKKKLNEKALAEWETVLTLNPEENLKETAVKHIARLKKKAE